MYMADRQKNKQTDRQAGRQAERQADGGSRDESFGQLASLANKSTSTALITEAWGMEQFSFILKYQNEND